MLIAAPGMKGGQVSRSLVEFVDLYPTVAESCGLKIPHKVAGTSLRPVLVKPDAVVKDAAYTLVSRGPKLYGQSLRNARWRFIRWSDGQVELYDHDQDHEELHNVADQHADIVSELTKKLLTIGEPKQ
jgi:uncharacterized sulfatase